jgi:chemotaxis protein methyltransferase CheR
MELINDEDFRLLRDFITERCGITYNEKQKYLFQQKILKRLEKNGLKTFKEYYYLLKYNLTKQELEELFNVLTVNETYFFREKEHIYTLRDFIIPKMLEERPNRTIKILSAGCSTGEEAYSTSIILGEAFSNQKRNIDLVGIDISKKAVDIAQSGVYRKISLTFRAVDKTFLIKYFDIDNDNLKLKNTIKNSVRFKNQNLFEFNSPILQDKYDIIFCRNVMIYFDKNHKQDLVNHFGKILNDDGYLILGCTENINDLDTNFKTVRINNTFLYSKE